MSEKVKRFSPSLSVPDFYINNPEGHHSNAFQVIEDLEVFSYYSFQEGLQWKQCLCLAQVERMLISPLLLNVYSSSFYSSSF